VREADSDRRKADVGGDVTNGVHEGWAKDLAKLGLGHWL
jgi:hypothetical protein